jgi:hypothetical protein
MKVIICAALGAMLCAPVALANPYKGYDLHADCKDTSKLFEGYCAGYIVGIVQVMQSQGSSAGRRACIPPSSILRTKFRDLVVDYMQDNRPNLSWPAADVVAQAMAEAYPCHRW